MLDIRVIIGRLTREPEIKEVAEGLKVARFTVACDGDFKDKDGNKKTEFIDCEAWRASADFVENYVGKGRLVALCGRMKTDEWEDTKFKDNDGTAVLRRKNTLTVDKIYPLDKAAGSSDSEYETPEAGARPARGGANTRQANGRSQAARGAASAATARPAAGGSTPARGSLPQW